MRLLQIFLFHRTPGFATGVLLRDTRLSIMASPFAINSLVKELLETGGNVVLACLFMST